MVFEKYTIRVTQHAHEQYEKRVEPIKKDELQQLLTEQVAGGEFYYKQEFIRLDGVWWVYEIREDVMIFVTSYGRTHIHVPSALRWARLHNDRIDLTGSEVICDEKAE